MQFVNNKKLLIAISIVYALIQMTLTLSVIVLQFDALNARRNAVRQRDYMTCILQLLPDKRTNTAIESCKASTIEK